MLPNRDTTPKDKISEGEAAYIEGRNAMLAGQSIHHNPFTNGTPNQRDWFNGYLFEHLDFCKVRREMTDA